MADCPVHGVPHRGCDLVPTEAQVEAAIEAIEAEEVSNPAVKSSPRRGQDSTPEVDAEATDVTAECDTDA